MLSVKCGDWKGFTHQLRIAVFPGKTLKYKKDPWNWHQGFLAVHRAGFDVARNVPGKSRNPQTCGFIMSST